MNDLWMFLKLYRRQSGWLSLGILLAICTLIASAGLLTLSGWFITAASIAGLTTATALTFNFFTPGAGVRGFSIARTAARYGERLVSHNATFKLLAWLRYWFFQKLIPVSSLQLKKYRKGALLDRLVADIDALDQLYLRLVSPLLSAVLVTALMTLFLSFFSVKLSLILMGIATGWIVLMPVLFYFLGRRAGHSIGKYQGELRQGILDFIQGMAELNIYGAVTRFRKDLSFSEQLLHHNQEKMAMFEGLGSALFIAGSGLSLLLVLFVGAGEFQLGQIGGAVLVMMVFATLGLFEALMPLPAAFQFLSHTRSAAGRLREVTEEKVTAFTSQKSVIPEQIDIEFKEISFTYGSESVLDNLSLNIPAGEHLAILGRTGCGKSTLISLLNRSLEVTSGTLRLAGQSIDSCSEPFLYGLMTYIPQQTHVFSGTLRENLLLAKPDACDEELLTIIQRSGLTAVGAGQASSKQLLELWIGVGGVILSGGEKRRLAAARALLKPAPVLIMDEPGEGLDEVSEKELLNELLAAFSQSTIIMITHKHTLLQRMDRVGRMEQGRLTF